MFHVKIVNKLLRHCHSWLARQKVPPVKYFMTVLKRYFFCGSFMVFSVFFFSVLCLLRPCVHLFICALCSPAGKGLTSWLSFVVSKCEFVTFPLVPWVRCGT